MKKSKKIDYGFFWLIATSIAILIFGVAFPEVFGLFIIILVFVPLSFVPMKYQDYKDSKETEVWNQFMKARTRKELLHWTKRNKSFWRDGPTPIYMDLLNRLITYDSETYELEESMLVSYTLTYLKYHNINYRLIGPLYEDMLHGKADSNEITFSFSLGGLPEEEFIPSTNSSSPDLSDQVIDFLSQSIIQLTGEKLYRRLEFKRGEIKVNFIYQR